MARTMLVVDDHAGFRAVACAIARSAGYDVVGEASDGAEALDSAARLHPEVVLLDVELPDMTGFDVADRLAAGPDTPVVVLVSGRRPTDFGGRLASAAAAGFIAKEDLSEAALDEVLA